MKVTIENGRTVIRRPLTREHLAHELAAGRPVVIETHGERRVISGRCGEPWLSRYLKEGVPVVTVLDPLPATINEENDAQFFRYLAEGLVPVFNNGIGAHYDLFELLEGGYDNDQVRLAVHIGDPLRQKIIIAIDGGENGKTA